MVATRIDPDFLLPTNEEGAAGSLEDFCAEVIAAINEHADHLDDTGIFRAADYGVVADGTTDDSAALRLALAAAQPVRGTVVMPDGTSIVSRDGGNFYCINVPAGVTLRGTSRANSIIKQAAGAAISVRLLYASGADTAIEDLTLDGNKANQTVNEQRHGIFADGTTRLHLARVTAKNFTGDGIYLYTNANYTTVFDCYATSNDRNGITLGGGGCTGISIIGGQYIGNAAQQVDSEPGGAISDVSISGGCVIDAGGISNDYVLTISGVDRLTRSRSWTISNCVINGPVFCVWTDNVSFIGCRGISASTDKPHCTIYRKCVGVSSVGCHWRSTANVGTDNMVFFVSGTDNVNGDQPSRISIIGGSVKNDLGAGMGIYSSGSEDILIQGVNVEGAGTNTPGYWGVYIRSVLAAYPTRSARVLGNHIKNFGSGAVAFAGSGAAQTLAADCSHNTFDATAAGVMPIGCSFNVDGSGAVQEATFIGNNATGNPAVISDYPASGVVMVGGNQGAPALYSCGAAPAFSATDGSLALNRVGAAATTLYIRVAGAWVAK